MFRLHKKHLTQGQSGVTLTKWFLACSSSSLHQQTLSKLKAVFGTAEWESERMCSAATVTAFVPQVVGWGTWLVVTTSVVAFFSSPAFHALLPTASSVCWSSKICLTLCASVHLRIIFWYIYVLLWGMWTPWGRLELPGIPHICHRRHRRCLCKKNAWWKCLQI